MKLANEWLYRGITHQDPDESKVPMSLSERLQQAAAERLFAASQRPESPSGETGAGADDAGALPRPTIDLREPTPPITDDLPHAASPDSVPRIRLWERPEVETIGEITLATVTELPRPSAPLTLASYSGESALVPAGEGEGRHRPRRLRDLANDARLDISLDEWQEGALSADEERHAQLASLYEIIAAERQRHGIYAPETGRADASTNAPAPDAKRPLASVVPAERPGRLPRLHRRDLVPKRQPAPEPRACPACGAPARIDIHDPFRGRMHLSCNVCFKMWQELTEPVETSHESIAMRD